MKINHIALWAKDIEKMRDFYEKYFQAKSNDKYINEKKGFQSYFLSFQSGCRLEIMHSEKTRKEQPAAALGLCHLAFSLGSKEAVDEMTEKLMADGYSKIDGPRTTGDGYYESVFLDPEGNKIELTV